MILFKKCFCYTDYLQLNFTLVSQIETGISNSNTIQSSSIDISNESSIGEHICTICNKAFSRLDILKKHVKSSHTNASHCAACGQDFADRLALAKHQTEVRTIFIHLYWTRKNNLDICWKGYFSYYYFLNYYIKYLCN